MENNEIITLKLTKSQADDLRSALAAVIVYGNPDYYNKHLELWKDVVAQCEKQETSEIKESV